MGFSLRNFFNDAVAQVNPFDHGQSAVTNQQVRQQQRPPVAFTPPPSANVQQPPAPVVRPTIQPAYGTPGSPAQAQTLRNMLTATLNPSVTANPVLPNLQQPPAAAAPAIPANATQIYHDKQGNVTGWEDPSGSHLTPAGVAAAPKNGDTRGGASKVWDQLNPFDNGRSFKQEGTSDGKNGSIIHQVAHNGVTNAVGDNLVKPVVNTVTGDIIYPVDSMIAQAMGDKQAQAIADQKAAEAQAASLPQMIVKPFAKTIYGLGNVPDALRGEFDAMSSDPTIRNSGIQRTENAQKRVFGTTDSGQIATQIAGDTAAEMLTVAAPEVSKFATAAVAPAIDELANPVVQALAKTAVHGTTGSAIGAGFNVANVYGDHPNVTAQEAKKAAIQGAEVGAAFGVTGDVAKLAQDKTPALVDYAKTHADTIKSLQGNEVGAIGKDVTPPADDFSKLEANNKKVISAADKALAENKQLMDEQNGTSGSKAPKKTGVVDKQLQQIQDAKKSVVNTAADDLLQQQKAGTDIHGQIRAAGGISASDHEGLPSTLKNKNGLPMDEMAANLGFADDQALMDAIDNQTAGNKPLNRTQARAQVQQELESGKHPYSKDYAEMTAAEKARQDQLAASYPKGTRSQVKVTDKAPAGMSEEEYQALLKTPEAQARPAGNKVVSTDGKGVIRNADAERQVIDSLNKGAHSDTVLNDYMKATNTTLQQAVKDVNRVAKEANIETGLGKNPLEGTVKLPKVQEGDWRQATLNSRFVQAKEQEIGSHALESYKALSPKDQVLLRKIEGDTVSNVAKKAEDPTAFKQAEKDLRTYFDTRHAYDTHLGIDVGYRTNYIRHFFDKAEEGDIVPTGDEQLHGGGANKAPGYTKARTVESLAKNVGDALERDIQSSSFNHAKLSYENGLNDAFPGKIANGEIPRSGNDGKYVQIDHPFGNDLSAPKSIAHDINTRVWHPNDSVALDRYDAVNRGLKYVKLSGGLFHAFTESGNFLGEQLTSGKMFTDPVATGKLVKVFFSDKAMQHEVARMADTGVLDKAHLSGLTIRPKEILADANVNALDSGKNAVAKYTGVQAMHDATFQREIPYAKLKIFEQKTEGLDPMKPEDLAVMRKQAESINNLFGGINREIHGIKPGTFKWLQRGLLATDFTEGKFKTLANALTDKGAAGTTARQAVAGKALLFAVVATAGAAAGGNYQGKSKAQIAKDAAGNLIDPSFEMGGYKVGLPKTHISEVVDALKPTNKTGKSWNASGLVSYAQNRSAALPSEAISLLSNKNYYGQPLYGTNTKKNGGGKISAPQAGLNIAQTVLPIPFGQATNTVSGKQSPAAAAANIVGFKARPNPDNTVTFDGVPTTMNDKQTEQYQTALKQNTDKITGQLTNSASFKALSPNDQAAALSELKSNITSATQRDFASKNSLGQYAPDYKKAGTEASTKEQDILSGKINPDAYSPGSSANGTNDSYAVSQFKKSNAKSTTIGNDTYYKKSDGTVAHTSTFDYTTTRAASRNTLDMEQAKASDNFSTWKNTAVNQLKLYQQQAAHYDPETESDKIDALQVKADNLVAEIQKYNSYGGSFTKPKSGRSGRSTNGISYKVFDPSSYEKSLRSILDAARVT